ncbi:cysteine peptidase family C39 domain-containing protein [Halomonas sp. KM072]
MSKKTAPDTENIPQSHWVRQRTENDCGCAALAILLGLSYEEVANAWRASLNREPNGSTYTDLLKVAAHLGYTLKRGRTTNGIRRIRPEPRANYSHWVVLLGNWIYCPTVGIYHKDHYAWKAWGDGLEII